MRLPLEVETIKKLLINILIMWPTHAKKVVCKTQFYRHKFFICSFWSQLQLIFHLQQMRKQRHLFAAGWVVCWEKDYVVWVVQRRRGMNILNKQEQSLFLCKQNKTPQGKVKMVWSLKKVFQHSLFENIIAQQYLYFILLKHGCK